MSKYDGMDLINDVDGVKDSVDSKKGALDKGVENINSFSEINKWNEVYNNPDATLEEKQYAGVQIMNAFFSLGEGNIPSEIGGGIFGSNILDEGKYVIGKKVFVNAITSAYDGAEGEREQALAEMLRDVDASYEAYKIAMYEKVAQNFPSSSTEWDKFYESYQENNDYDEIADNIFEGYDKLMSEVSEKLGLLDETTPQGNIAKKMSDALFNGIEYWKDGVDIIVNGINQFGENWLTGIEIIQNAITNGIVRKTKTKTNTARTTRYDPLILDLDGDGFNVEKKELGANFDLDKNGFAEKINWTSRYNLKRKRVFDMVS